MLATHRCTRNMYYPITICSFVTVFVTKFVQCVVMVHCNNDNNACESVYI